MFALLAPGLLVCNGCSADSPAKSEATPNQIHWWSDSSQNTSVALDPRAVVDDLGRSWAIWIHYESSGARLELVCGEEQEPIARTPIEVESDWVAAPDLTPWKDGVLCVWEAGSKSGAGRKILARTARLSGSTIELGPSETAYAGAALTPKVCRTGKERIELVGVAAGAEDLELFRVTRDASGWSPPNSILPSAGDCWSPVVAGDASGRLHVAWDSFDGERFQVSYAQLENGQTIARHEFENGAGYQAYASLAIEPGGAVWIAWEQAEQFGAWGGLRATRSLGLARVNNGELRYATSESLPAAELRCDFPQLAWDENGLIVSMRGLGPSFAASARKLRANVSGAVDRETTAFTEAAPRSRVYIDSAARFFTSWWTRVLTFDASGQPRLVELPQTEGDNEATESLLITKQGPVALFAADLRSTLRPRPSPFESPIEGHWRVGSLELPRSQGTPRLSDKPPSNPTWTAKRKAPTSEFELPTSELDQPSVFFGDLHRHTHLSRCAGAHDGTAVDAYRYARGPGALDFIAITDHFQHLQPWSWWRHQRDVARFHAPGRLVVFSGIERASKQRGHRNDVFLDGTGVVFDPKSWDSFPEVGEKWVAPDTSNTLSIPHMMGRSESPWRWRWMQSDLHRLFEIYQGARGSYEGAGQPLVADDFDVPRSGVGPGLADGHMFGFIAASDHGSSALGLAGVEAGELTRESIFVALRARHTFAATTAVHLQTELGSLRSGDAGSAGTDAPLIVRANGGASTTAPIACVDVFKNGKAWRRLGGEQDGSELVLLTTRRWGPYEANPMSVSVSDATLKSTNHRRADFSKVQVSQYNQVQIRIVKAREALDLVIELTDVRDSTALGLSLGADSIRQSLMDLPLGQAMPLDFSFESEQLCRLGPSLAESNLEREFSDADRKPGDSYYVRVIFEDGNLAWSSPIRVTEFESATENEE